MTRKKTEEFLPRAVSENLVVQELNDELLIYNLQTNKAYCLNKTSALVWNCCNGATSVKQIREILSEKFNLLPTEEFVWLALNDLKKESLLVNREEIENRFKGLSRRALIRQAGLTSAAALPVIYSLLAPTAASAQSGGVCGNSSFDTCTTDADCLTSPTGDTCENNCCIFGGGIPGGVCIPSPINPCPVTPPCDPFFGC